MTARRPPKKKTTPSGRVTLDVGADKKARLQDFAEARGTTPQALMRAHVDYLLASELGVVVDDGRGLDPQLLKWSLDFAQMNGTTLNQLIIDHLTLLRKRHSHALQSI